MTRDHGGNLDAARARFGDGDWIDLSTGINPRPYPVPDLPPDTWTRLPSASDRDALEQTARGAYNAPDGVSAVALAGAQAAIQTVPALRRPGRARVLSPTYNEHAATLRAAGWQVDTVGAPQQLAGADLAVLVNPNNPDGRTVRPADLAELARSVGLLVIDESFGDVTPHLSFIPRLNGFENTVVLRSFGKFFGLAGLRLGFALACDGLANRFRDGGGPWPVSGAAIRVGRFALQDIDWQATARHRLAHDAARLDRLAERAGWTIVGGCDLFRTYETPDATAVQDRLAAAHIWSRIFPYDRHWVRLGLPDGKLRWDRLSDALSGCR